MDEIEDQAELLSKCWEALPEEWKKAFKPNTGFPLESYRLVFLDDLETNNNEKSKSNN